MNNEIKVIAKDGKVEVLAGNSFHVLNDTSSDRFDTQHIEEFFNYIKTRNATVFYTTEKLSAFQENGDELRDVEPIAFCSLQISDQLKAVVNMRDQKYDPERLERTIQSLGKYCDTNAKDLVALLRDQSIKKILDIKRKKDNRGNYLFSFQIETGGIKDVEYPENISFTVPVYKHRPETTRVAFDLIFSFEIEKKESSASVDLTYELKNYSLLEDIAEAQERLIMEFIKKSPCTAWRGSWNIIKKDDSWKYLPNPQK